MTAEDIPASTIPTISLFVSLGISSTDWVCANVAIAHSTTKKGEKAKRTLEPLLFVGDCIGTRPFFNRLFGGIADKQTNSFAESSDCHALSKLSSAVACQSVSAPR